ncbi:unnamed protein product, partial [Cuscuta epithymum]
MGDLLALFNDASTLQLIHMASTCGQCEIYVEHGLDECELILPLPGPNNEGVIEEFEVQVQGLTPEEEMQTNVRQSEAQMHSGKVYELHPEADDSSSEEERHDSMEEICEDGHGNGNLERDKAIQEDEAEFEEHDSDLADLTGTNDNNDTHEEATEVDERDNDVHVGSESRDKPTPEAETEFEEHDPDLEDLTGRNDKNDTDEDADSVEYDSSNPGSYTSDKEIDDKQSKPPHINHVSYNPESEPPLIEVAMLFEDARQFKNAMVRYAVFHKRDIRYVKNTDTRVRIKCAPPCPYNITASWEPWLKCFQVKVLESEHLCNLRFKLRIVSEKWIAETYEEKVLENPSMGAVELKELIKSELKINVSASMATRALRDIQKKTERDFKHQFMKLRNYAEECLRSIPDSTVVIHTTKVVPESPSIFQRIYMCFGPVKRGFLEGCRKVIGLDGCFLKGQLKGEILTAVGRDANNQMFPIAWAVVEIENNSSWTWFLELLKSDLQITRPDLWTLISDQQKGLCNVIANIFPEAEHRNCARHIHANWSKSHRGMVFRKLFWKCAKSTCEPQLIDALAEVDKADIQAGTDLRKYSLKLWCKAYFRTEVKCDTVDNNLSEAFNSSLLKCRSKPLIPMLEDIRVGMMKRIAKKRKYVERWPGNFGPIIMKKLNKNVLASQAWHVDFNGDDGYEIKKGRHQFKVSLNRRTCSCRKWDLSGIPCAHSICAILDKGDQPEDYVDRWYSKELYQKTYSYTLQPINGELLWPRTEHEEMLPPLPRKMCGRPKKKRVREETEQATSNTKLSRKGRIMTCSICHKEGHNKSSCPNKKTPTEERGSGTGPSLDAGGSGHVNDDYGDVGNGRGGTGRGGRGKGRGRTPQSFGNGRG